MMYIINCHDEFDQFFVSRYTSINRCINFMLMKYRVRFKWRIEIQLNWNIKNQLLDVVIYIIIYEKCEQN